MNKRMFVGMLAVCMFAASAFAGDYNFRFAKNKTSPSRMTVNVRNVSGITQTVGTVVVYTTSTIVTVAGSSEFGNTGYIGVDVSTSASANSKLWAGVLAESIADGNYGKVYVKGYCVVKTSGTVASGAGLGVGSVAPYAMTSTTAGAVFATAIESGSTTAGADTVICILR